MRSGVLVDGTEQPNQLTLYNRLCIPVPYAGGRIFETGDEKIFQLNRNKGNYLRLPSRYRLTVTSADNHRVYKV